MPPLLRSFLLPLFFFLPLASVQAAKVVFISGKPSHGPMEHEHRAGNLILAEALRDPDLGIEAVVLPDPPTPHLRSTFNANSPRPLQKQIPSIQTVSVAAIKERCLSTFPCSTLYYGYEAFSIHSRVQNRKDLLEQLTGSQEPEFRNEQFPIGNNNALIL